MRTMRTPKMTAIAAIIAIESETVKQYYYLLVLTLNKYECSTDRNWRTLLHNAQAA